MKKETNALKEEVSKGVLKKIKERAKRALSAEKQLIEGLAAPFARTTSVKVKEKEAQNLASVVVISRSYSYSTGLSVVRSLGEAGYSVDYIAIKGLGNSVVKSSKYVRQYVEVKNQRKRSLTEQELLNVLTDYLEKDNQKPVLFPVDDYMAAFVDKNRSVLGDIFLIPGITSDDYASLTEYMDKSVQSRLALTAGLPVPKEWIVSLENIPEIPEDMVYPCFCKPLESISGMKTEMAICEDEEDLAIHLKKLRKHRKDRKVLVQEYLKIDQEYAVQGVCIDQDIIIPGVIKKTIVSKKTQGVTLSGQMLPFESLGEICTNVKQMLKDYHYTGMFDLELNCVNGKIYFGEMNFRCGGPNFACFCNGVNLPAMFAERVSNRERKTETAKIQTFGKSFISERVAYDEWLNGYLSYTELKQEIKKADNRLLKYDRDPKPWTVFSERLVPYIYLRKTIKKDIKATGRATKTIFISPARQTIRTAKELANGYPIEKKGIAEEVITEEPTVVVLSRSYSTGLSVVRSVGAAGFLVDLVASSHRTGRGIAVAASSRYVRHYVEVVSRKVKSGQDKRLLRQLLKYSPESPMKPVLFPTDDYTASVMDQNRELLSDRFIMPGVSDDANGAMTACMDKTFQSNLAKEAGLMIPKEWIISLEEGIEIPEEMIYPCYVKPIESISGYKTEMAKCEDERQLTQHLRKLRRNFRRRSVLVQEYLNIDTEIDFSGVCLDQEVIIPGIIRKTGIAQYERGVTLSGKIEPFETLGEACEPVLRMLRAFHYRGMFDMELNLVGDKLYFNEVNLRSGGPNYSYYLSGANLPALYVRAALGQERKPKEELVREYGKPFISERVVWDDYLHGFLTRQERKERLNGTDLTIIRDNDDPRPWAVFQRMMQISEMRKDWRTCKALLGRGKRRIKRVLFSSLRKIKYSIFQYPQTKKGNQRDPNADKPRILITGRNYCSNLCMARSFGKAGYEVEVLRIFQSKQKWRQYLTPEAYSKYVKAYYACVTNHKSRRLVQKLVFLAEPGRKMLLIPNDDLSAEIVDDNYEELSQYYLIPNINNTPGEISRLMSKEIQKKLAIEAGLPVVNGCMIEADHGIFEIPDTVTYPCFLKPNISKNSAKRIMKRCDTEEELRETLEEYSKRKKVEILVEDYLEIKAEYSLLGLSTKEKVLGPGYFVAEYGGHVERRGVAMTGVVLPPSVHQKLVDQLVSFIGTLHYDGLYDVDLIETTDGKVFFVELNFRYGASGYAVTECGLNLPGMFADYMIFGKPVDEKCTVPETGKHFISEKVMIDEYKAGFLKNLDEVKSYMNQADIHFIKNEEDPGPYRHFSLLYPITAIKRRAVATG